MYNLFRLLLPGCNCKDAYICTCPVYLLSRWPCGLRFAGFLDACFLHVIFCCCSRGGAPVPNRKSASGLYSCCDLLAVDERNILRRVLTGSLLE